ncbi:MAG: T9SS type A sorting domain-containing protein [Bacteroidetes bacterium]|nr:T9SS type A sorting domain-containing protein [Bacteroidota bacterium]
MPIASTIRQVTDTNLSVCGGELGKIGNDYYLMFGHNFGGRYDPASSSSLFTQTYSDRIKKFNLADDGTTITLSGFTYQVDTNNFHRRDLNIGPVINTDGSLGIGAYGGAFRKDSVLPFREPIKIDASGITINTAYQQVMNHYTCALMPIYDSLTQSMYTTFFGGISLYDYDNTTSTLLRDIEVPFIDDITTMTVNPGGINDETILPVKLPGLLGSNAKFIHTQHLPSYPNEVIKIRQLSNTKTLAGYMLGGIRAQQGNFGTSSANDTIYRVYITPNNTVGIDELNDITNVQLYPNPSTNSTTLLFNLSQAASVTILLLDINAKEIFRQTEAEMQKGNQKIQLNTSKLATGIYICKIRSNSGEQTLKLVVGR